MVVGYPSPDESGILIDTAGFKYSVCEHSSPEAKQGVWEFIKTLLSYDIQYDMTEEYGFPVNYEVFKKRGEEELYSIFVGEKTPEETAEIINNRAGILISERY